MRKRLVFYLLTLLLFTQYTSGQYYDTGQDPSSLKWMQIKTDHFTVIYPKIYDKGGIAFAKSLDEAYSKIISLYPEKKFKIPVVIHSLTTQSNGYVAWAPRRMELYPTPEQNSIPLDQNEQLAIHELTHVFQMESLNQGFSKAMSFLLGEQVTGAVASLLPLWFMEGDAVFAESLLTESGRGRTPSFQKELKSLAVESGRMYKYDKIVNGSFRDYVPDHYKSGYQMVTWAMSKYNPQIWNRVLSNTGRQPFTINPVNISLRSTAGLTKKKLFRETFDTLKTIWTQEVSTNNSISYDAVNPSKGGHYINYYSPVFAGNDSIIAIKTSLSAPPSFVLINPSKKTEKRIHIPGQMYPWFISYGKGKLTWVEVQSDQRWENRNYSVIKVMDLHSRLVTRLSRKSRYMSVSLSPDGSTIAAVENSVSNTNSIDLVDSETGSVILSVGAPGNVYLEHPQWSENGKKITVIYLTEAGEGIMSFVPESQKWETLLEAGREDLQSAFLRNDSLFFISSLSGTDNIYFRTPGSKVIGITRSKFGTIDLCLKGEKVLFSDYTSLGNNISITNLTEVKGITGSEESSQSFLINRVKVEQNNSGNSSTKEYTPEPYRKWQHLFKFHSWMPFYADIETVKSDPASVRPGISIMSQNQLSTLITSFGYEYSPENNHVIHSRITWNGWYLVIESQLDYGNDPRIYKILRQGEVVSDPSDIRPGLRFSNTISLPLSFSSGRFSEYLRLSVTSDYRNEYVYLRNPGTYDYGQIIMSGRIYFSNYHRSAIRDIYPRWAQTLDLNYSYAPFDKDIYGSAITFKSSFYFPGFLPDNGIKISFQKEKQVTVMGIFFGNRVSLPRGYNNIFPQEISLLSADYVIPLVYPDFNVGSLLYLKRIRTGLFYDYASGPGNTFFTSTSRGLIPLTNSTNPESFRSFGVDLLADFHVFRIPYMISGGVQTAWKNFNERPAFKLLFNIDLYGMSIGKRQM